MPKNAEENSLFAIDEELDLLLDEMQEELGTQGGEEVCPEMMLRWQQI